jgi:hypothetical protein
MRTVLVITAAMYSSCSCLDAGSGGSGGGTGGEGGGSDTPDFLDAGIHFQCANLNRFDQPLIDATASALQPPLADGTAEVGLEDAGCWRLTRTVSGGELTALDIKRFSGEGDFVIEGENLRIFEKPDYVLVHWDGTKLSIDADLDRFAEHETTLDVGTSGLVKLETVDYSPSTKLVRRRLTFTPSGTAGQMHNKDETLVGGALVAREWDSAALQKQLGPPTCMFQNVSEEVPCPDPQAIKQQLSDAILEGAKCMQGMDNPLSDDFVKLMILRNQIASRVDVHCTRQTAGNQYAAAVDTSRPGGRIPLYVNAELATCGTTYANSSLFHEFIHLITGGHDDALLDRYFNMGMLLESEYTYFDRMRSCEAMCFGTKLKTRCACARCLRTTTCDPRCDSMGSCIQRPSDGGMAVMSEAVGAVCHSGQGSLHKTMAACASACSGGAMSCESKSLSCDPTCQ